MEVLPSEVMSEEEHEDGTAEKCDKIKPVPDPNRIIRRRKRVLACPICKKVRHDGFVVHDGDMCKGGHVIVNNAEKIWQCQQV